jgi:hypothetical protein
MTYFHARSEHKIPARHGVVAELRAVRRWVVETALARTTIGGFKLLAGGLA